MRKRSSRMTFSKKDVDDWLKNNDQLSIDKTVNQFDPEPDPVQKENKDQLAKAKVERDGMVFDSGEEAKRYSILKLWEQAGIITNLTTQHVDIGKPQSERIHRWVISEGYTNHKGKRVQTQYYIDDFQYEIDGILIVEDYKGYERRTFINKKKVFESRYPEVNYYLNFSLTGWYPNDYPEHWAKLKGK